MTPRDFVRPDTWPWIALLASAALLAGAHAFEAAGYAPCTLCLRQREAHWAIVGIAGAKIALGFLQPAFRTSRPAVWLLAGAFLFSAGLAAFHAGVEWKWWPGPETCAAGSVGPVSLDGLSDVLSGEKKVRPPACDEAAWTLLGVSMAGWNALISLSLAVLSIAAARSAPRAR